MLQYGFFDSEIAGFDEEGMPVFDRAESSDFLAMFISHIISSGVLALPGDCFQVLAGGGMKLKVRPGFAVINGRFAADGNIATITVPEAPQSGKRIDRVVLRANRPERLCELMVKEGVSAVSPAAPALLQLEDGDYYELCLATVAVNSHQTVITQANITDTRFDSSVCGIVTQVIDHLDTSVFFEQMAGAYNRFVNDANAYLKRLEAVSEMQLATFEDIDSILDGTYGKGDAPVIPDVPVVPEEGITDMEIREIVDNAFAEGK